MSEERGSLHIPLALLLFAAAAAAFGLWGLMRHWRGLAHAQLALDGCVAREAKAMRSMLESVEASNRRLAAFRLAVVATPSARAAAEAEALYQEAQRARWRAAGVVWLARLDCGLLRGPWPHDPWVRDPPDPLGPGLLRWSGPRKLRLEVLGRLRSSAAEVRDEKARWISVWSRPRVGAGAH